MKNKEFTLVELLVVMAILGVLVTLVAGGFRTAQVRGRDSKRKSDLKEIANSLEVFYSDHNRYPEENNGIIQLSNSFVSLASNNLHDIDKSYIAISKDKIVETQRIILTGNPILFEIRLSGTGSFQKLKANYSVTIKKGSRQESAANLKKQFGNKRVYTIDTIYEQTQNFMLFTIAYLIMVITIFMIRKFIKSSGISDFI